ncbi:MAG TPA: group II intron reverse transcriptase/maturase [Polyangiaceae bacterium]|nr:group II intron reverse transcriptase/maturase [Polyangiaceae bacterium]
MDSHLSPGSKSSARAQQASAREPGDLDGALPVMVTGEPAQQGVKPQTGASIEKSDEVVVPKKAAKTWVTPVEPAEGRTEAKGKSATRNASSTLGEREALTFLQRIGERAKQKPKAKWTNLLSHIKAPLLKEAYQRLRQNAAVGVDEVTWLEYGERLDERLLDLQDRVHRGSYHPQPVRRVLIPKGDGKMRPLGIPALEDKIVQQAARMVLEPILEAEFIGFSYGFRPKRSQHDALDALAAAIRKKVNWVLDADIEAFFDTIDHRHLQTFLEHRIGDTRMVRLLMKWAKAGVLEDGKLHETDSGTPQGGIISPLLANLYLHYVLDLWVLSWRKKYASGEMYVVRYADDFVMGFQKEQDALTMHKALAERLAQFALKLHPQKTRVIEFGRSAGESRACRGLAKPETFDFLGFTHIAGISRAGKFQLKRRTSRKKRRAKLARLKEECDRRRHHRVTEQHRWLKSVLDGHYRYYAVPTNYRALAQFQRAVRYMWHRALQRRSQRARWTRARQNAFDARFPLPAPRILHPWPDARFALR